jgi:hypothetical protein
MGWWKLVYYGYGVQGVSGFVLGLSLAGLKTCEVPNWDEKTV